MRIQTYDIKTVVILWSLTVVSFVCSLGGTLTSGNPWQGILVAWVSFAGFLGVSVHFTYKNSYRYQFKDVHGIYVTWDNAGHAIRQEEFEATIEQMLQKMECRYSTARVAIRECVVIFREPVWMFNGRKVAGLQDGYIISVGWSKHLGDSALAHELGHRILQVCAGDPGEDYGHKIMMELGVI